jgi:hypothetical protein
MGQGLTAKKMKDCRSLKLALVEQFEFREWTPDNHLRHSRFVGLRDEKEAREVTRELSRRQRPGFGLRKCRRCRQGRGKFTLHLRDLRALQAIGAPMREEWAGMKWGIERRGGGRKT